MQNTRFNSLISTTTGLQGRWFLNLWRRLSFFLGTAVSTIAGQSANRDIIGAGILGVAEVVNRIYSSCNQRSDRSWIEALNALIIGLTYLFIESL